MAFPSVPMAVLGGREGSWAAGGGTSSPKGSWRPGLVVRGMLHSAATHQCPFCCYRGLEAGVGQLQGFWRWPGTGVLPGMSLRLCKGMSPGHFFLYKTSPASPVCPGQGRRKAAWSLSSAPTDLKETPAGAAATQKYCCCFPSCRVARKSKGAAVVTVAPWGCGPRGVYTQTRHPACPLLVPLGAPLTCQLDPSEERPARNGAGLRWGFGSHPSCVTQSWQGQLAGGGRISHVLTPAWPEETSGRAEPGVVEEDVTRMAAAGADPRAAHARVLCLLPGCFHGAYVILLSF